MKEPTTVQLRLRGIMPRQLASALVAAAPLGWVAWLTLARHSPIARAMPALLALCAAVAALPWLSLWAARASYRAKCDDVAVHLRGEALPYKTIRELRVERTPRRVTLHLVRAEDIQLALVLWDAFAGRLEPLGVLRQRLGQHGLSFDFDG
jgi:hypothetical protein